MISGLIFGGAMETTKSVGKSVLISGAGTLAALGTVTGASIIATRFAREKKAPKAGKAPEAEKVANR